MAMVPRGSMETGATRWFSIRWRTTTGALRKAASRSPRSTVLV